MNAMVQPVLNHRRRAGAARSLRNGLALSALVHMGMVAAVIAWGLREDPPRPPVYRIEMVGAPAGTRQAGVVTPKPAETVESKANAPSGAEQLPAEKTLPVKKAPPKATPKATPNPTRTRDVGTKSATPTKTAAPPKAGSGRDAGKGTDVRNIALAGIEFPFPGYLTNIMRQITIAYAPQRTSATLVAEVKFVIRRDGSVVDIEVVKSSGNRLFDLEAKGTIESVGAVKAFGPLPTGWNDDVLVVYFTFDYALRPT
jgi:protein TonB